MLKNSIRQLFRTKVRTFLFFVLLFLCALLLCIGCNLEYLCRQNIERLKEVFVTIGTVEQKPVSVERVGSWDAERQDYVYVNASAYGQRVPLSVLDMEEVSYISGPEQRAFYASYMPDYQILDEEVGWGHEFVLKASPVEDCIPDHPVKMEVEEILFGVYGLNMTDFYFCDHYNDDPKMLYADTTYIMDLRDSLPHGFTSTYEWDWSNPDNSPSEWIPAGGPVSGQTDEKGERLENTLPGLSVEAVDDAFYEAGHDKIWEAWIREREMHYHTIPVTVTEDLELLMMFYRGDAYVAEGRSFEAADYAEGKRVCLLPRGFAKRNGISVGDSLPLNFPYANYAANAVYGWGSCSLTAAGEQFTSFFEADYTVVGIYDALPPGDLSRAYCLAENEVIIPEASVAGSNAENIGFAGRLQASNTSFRIPNGTIDEFMRAWEKQGIADVEIRFYDGGYSRLESGLRQTEKLALLLVSAGIAASVLGVVFFCHLMIGRHKRRTAIERSLGASKLQSAASLLSGIWMLAGAGCVAGCIAGWLLTGRLAGAMEEKKEMFCTDYSAGIVYEAFEEEAGEEEAAAASLPLTVLSGTALFVFAAAVSGAAAWNNLQKEPLELLSGR